MRAGRCPFVMGFAEASAVAAALLLSIAFTHFTVEAVAELASLAAHGGAP